jgi:hypothetical protein
MAQPTQYSFDLREVALALIKQQGLHEGKWLVGFEFGMAAGFFGSSPSDIRPTAMLQIGKLQLVRAEDAHASSALVVDAAVENPSADLKERTRPAAKRQKG